MNLGQQLKEHGQQLAFDHAGERFKQEVMPALRAWIAAQKHYGTTEFKFEEFRAWCDRVDLVPTSNNAYGKIPAMAIKEGLIKPTGRYAKAASAKTRSHDVKIWEIV